MEAVEVMEVFPIIVKFRFDFIFYEKPPHPPLFVPIGPEIGRKKAKNNFSLYIAGDTSIW
jgi:hypothetical protein